MDCVAPRTLFFCASIFFLLATLVSTANILASDGLERSSKKPEQIHLSWDGIIGHMTVTWSTRKLDDSHGALPTIVNYGYSDSELSHTAQGTAVQFEYKGNVQQIHTATITGIDSTQTYCFYRVGSTNHMSDQTFRFRITPQNSSNWQPSLLLMGDMGTTNAAAFLEMTREAVQQHKFDLVIHNGDFAYDLSSKSGENGDNFMHMIQPLAAYVPYQTTVGNHEHKKNFTHYKNRFRMPGEGMYYALDMGPIHLVTICTEFYYYPQYGLDQIFTQYNWLQNELRTFREKNNSQWLIVMGHRPMYCSSDDPIDCNPWGSILRHGVESLEIPGLEELFRTYKVELYVGAHKHSYERLWPVYNNTVMNGSTDSANPYVDAKATTYLVTGAAGNKKGQGKFMDNPYDYSAFRSTDYGFARLQAFNMTHVFVDEVSINQGGKVIDQFWLVKTK